MIFVIDGVYQNPDKPKIMIFTKNGQVKKDCNRLPLARPI